MQWLRKHGRYAQYVFTHKFWVGYYCFQEGLYWRGIVHDLSKLLPSEWIPYANFFGVAEAERTTAKKEAFGLAWKRHLQRNSHHWNHWVIKRDNGGDRVFEMPLKDRIEMICDWKGVQRTLGKDDLAAWYLERRDTMTLGPKTRRWVDNKLGVK